MEMPKNTVIKFDLRNWEQGYWVEVEVPYTKKNWDWVVAHPNAVFVRKAVESKKPIVTFNAGR